MMEPVYYDFKMFGDNESDDIFHGFFGRRGGVSAGVYDGLNVGYGSDDVAADVQENRARIAKAVGVAPENLLTVYQEHGATCLTVTDGWDCRSAPKADAMVTDAPGMALGIMSADCAPVLFRAEVDGRVVIGAAHAGWRGAMGGILGATVEAMETLGAARAGIRAVIGPCIDKRSYEVGAEFYQAFIEADDENDRFFGAARKAGHFMFDLAGYCAFRLARAGLSQVYIKDMDTYSAKEDFFSYRRTTHRGEADYGRQLSVIATKG